MKYTRWTVAVLATLPALAAWAEPSAPTAATAVATPRVSQERLDAIRRTLQAQIAAHDAVEKAMRQPTDAEAAALSASRSEGAPRALAMPRGGLALRPDAASMTFLIADTAEGKPTLRHGSASSVHATTTKGGRDAR